MDAHDGDDGAPRPVRRRRRLTLVAIAWLAAGAVVASGVALLSDRSSRGRDAAFYEAPGGLAGAPAGAVLRSQLIPDPPQRAAAYRILYRSRGHDGAPVALSALLFVPARAAPSNGRSVVALAHGTVGVARACGVSDGRAFFDHVDGLARFLRAGYAVVVADLEGLGTPGPHPYLVGAANARATLDAVRATRRFEPADASARFVAWGVGAGGHTALFTAQEAPSYAPELELAGVAAGAPMANLKRLIEANAGTPAGDLLVAYVLSAWSRVYPRLRLDAIVTPAGRAAAERLAGVCVPLDHEPIGRALGGREVKVAYRTKAPWNDQPWSELLARNSPGTKTISVPVILTQGREDAFVRPAATARFARYLCGRGTTVQYRPSRGVAHRDVGEKTAPYVARWIAGRFAGEPARSTC